MQPEHNAMTEQRTSKPKRQKRAYAGGYSDADKKRIKDQVVAWVSEGKTLREFCRQQGMPHYSVVYDWRDDDEEFALRFARAREHGFDVIAEEALSIADTPCMGQITTSKEWGEEIKTEDMLGHRKLQIETRLKLLAKWFPQKYGERIEQHHTGGMSVTDVPLTEAQRAALDRALDGDV